MALALGVLAPGVAAAQGTTGSSGLDYALLNPPGPDASFAEQLFWQSAVYNMTLFGYFFGSSELPPGYACGASPSTFCP